MAKGVVDNFGKDKDGVKYQHPERTCIDCRKYPCFRGMINCQCDYAKYGCINYKDKNE